MIRAAALLSLLALALLASPAFAQNVNCGPRSTVVTSLLDKYGEQVQGIGLAANGAVMEVFASEDTGTWTVAVTLPNGMMCIIASGQSYERVTAEVRPNL